MGTDNELFRGYIGLKEHLPWHRKLQEYFHRETDFWESTVKTPLFTIVVVTGEFLLVLSFSLLMVCKFPLKRLWISLLIALLAFNPVVVAIIAWLALFVAVTWSIFPARWRCRGIFR